MTVPLTAIVPYCTDASKAGQQNVRMKHAARDKERQSSSRLHRPCCCTAVAFRQHVARVRTRGHAAAAAAGKGRQGCALSPMRESQVRSRVFSFVALEPEGGCIGMYSVSAVLLYRCIRCIAVSHDRRRGTMRG